MNEITRIFNKNNHKL